MNSQSKESGGIISFVIVSLALAGLLLGGLYYSKQTAQSAGTNTNSTIEIAKDNAVDKSSSNEPAKSAEESTPAAPSDSPSTPAQTTPPSRTETPAGPNQPKIGVTGPSQVAETGPADTLMTLIVLSGLAFAGSKAIQAHRRVTRSALNQ